MCHLRIDLRASFAKTSQSAKYLLNTHNDRLRSITNHLALKIAQKSMKYY